MKIADIITWEISTDELAHKFESDSLRLGSQLIVHPSQTAFFVKGGTIADEFTSGVHTIKSVNIPILEKLINIPFNGESPFKAEVWFVNQVSILDCKWGTSSNINIEDPKYNIIVPIRAYGQYGFRISNPRKFLEAFVGNMSSFSKETLTEYFKGIILSKLTSIISNKLLNDNASIVNISGCVDELSNYSELNLAQSFLDYGITLCNFSIMSISVNDNDASFIKLKEAKDMAAKISIIGTQNYQMERSFDVLDKAAANGGGIIGSSIELGAGLVVGKQVGNIASNRLNINPQTPPPIPIANYYIAINGVQQGPLSFEQIKSMISNKIVDSNTLVWKEGMANWDAILSLSEFNHFFRQMPPAIPQQ